VRIHELRRQTRAELLGVIDFAVRDVVQRHEAAPARGGLPRHAFAVGPQPAKTTRMLGESCKALTADRAWVGDRRDRLAAGQAQLNNAFAELLRR